MENILEKPIMKIDKIHTLQSLIKMEKNSKKKKLLKTDTQKRVLVLPGYKWVFSNIQGIVNSYIN